MQGKTDERFWLRLFLYLAMAGCVVQSARKEDAMAGLGAVVALAGLAITASGSRAEGLP